MTRHSIKVVLLLGLIGPLIGLKQQNYLSNPKSQSPVRDTIPAPLRYGFGRPAKEREIAILNIDIRPDGLGLPLGAGTATIGRGIYAAKCAACHGKTGTEGPAERLVSDEAKKVKAIGTYWPYATTLFDYIRRAMPFNAPGSLTNEEVYSLTAFLLNANGLIEEKQVINAKTLPKVEMPARKNFVNDDRKGGPAVR